MHNIKRIEERLVQFAMNYDLSFDMRWNSVRQLWEFEFRSRQFSAGCVDSLPMQDVLYSDPDKAADFIISNVKRLNFMIFKKMEDV